MLWMPEPPSHVLPSQQLTARWPMQTAWIIRFGSSHNWARSLLKHTKACFKSFVRVLDPYRQDTVQISKESWEVRRRGARTIGQGCPIRQRNVREGNELLTYQKSSLDDSREVLVLPKQVAEHNCTGNKSGVPPQSTSRYLPILET